MNKELISIIIPVYNGERFLSECLDSVINQTYKKLEIILINDGSIDSTQDIIDDYAKEHSYIRSYFQKNSGQGVARNKALEHAKGKYVAFVDADDLIHENFIEKLYEAIKRDNSDFAICDWMYYFESGNKSYVNKNSFMFNPVLENENTELILNSNVYFTVNKLYGRQFLKKNKIKYGEGYIYEDLEFYVKSSVSARKISIVHNPLYWVRTNPYSTTKTNYDGTWHSASFLKAITATFDKLSITNTYGHYYLYKYILERTYVYAKNRVSHPIRRREFIENVFKLLNEQKSAINIPVGERKKQTIILNHYLPKNKVKSFMLFNDFIANKKVKNLNKKLQNGFKLSTIKSYFKRMYYKYHLRRKCYNNSILFYGFDNRYVGNSKYFFDYLIKENIDNKIYFVAESSKIDKKHIVKPNSYKFWRLLARSKNIIYESWAPLKHVKRGDANWIQLWHGTPIKKMLFDSNEKFVAHNNIRHKLNKYKDIQKWDYFICENMINKKDFESAFLLNQKTMMAYGYPRVKYLIDNVSNSQKINDIKTVLGISSNNKIIFYAPTWRDYNYNSKDLNSNYLLNIEKLIKNLPENYTVIMKEHFFINTKKDFPGILNIKGEMETQDILLITDILISDYSSIIFDFFAMNKPVILFVNDLEKYSKARGVYDHIWKDLSFMCCNTEEAVIKKIQNIKKGKYPLSKIIGLKHKYTCKNVEYSIENIKGLLK